MKSGRGLSFSPNHSGKQDLLDAVSDRSLEDRIVPRKGSETLLNCDSDTTRLSVRERRG